MAKKIVPQLIKFNGKVKKVKNGIIFYREINDTQLMKLTDRNFTQLIENGKVLKIENPHQLPRRWVNFLSNENWCSVVGVLGDGYTGTNLFGNVYWGYYDDYRGRRNESGRYIYVRLENGALWNANFIPQKLIEPDELVSEFSPAFVKFKNKTEGEVGLQVETTYFVPADGSLTEIWLVKLSNITNKPRKLDITFGMDGFVGSRTFDMNHHLVAGLYNEAYLDKRNEIIYLYKSINYDEGESVESNKSAFFKVISPVKGQKNFFADEEYFLGNYHNRFGWNAPLSLMSKDYSLSSFKKAKSARGVDVIGAVEQNKIKLAPKGKKGDSLEFIVFAGAIIEDRKEALKIIKKFNTVEKVKAALEDTKKYWENINSKIVIQTGDKKLDERYNNWFAVQNYLRKRWGNTGSLYHDYGIDNFGWRDLWQDWLGWMYIEPEKCEEFIPKALAGTRLDGSVASGFKLDEKLNLYFMNDPIKGVWCDHPFWPTLTVNEFLRNIKGADYSLLLYDGIPYMRDIYRKRALSRDPMWLPINKIELTNKKGTVFEHLWVQIMSMFYAVDKNTGFLNHMRAGWDDALDQVFGGNVPFTMAFVWGANMLADMLEKLDVKNLKIYEAYKFFLGNYNASTEKKLKILDKITSAADSLNMGKKINVERKKLIKDLRMKAEAVKEFINKKAWHKKGNFYIGYYDSKGNPIDYYKSEKDYKLHLSAQTFALMADIVPDNRLDKLIDSTFKKLWDKKAGGLLLNTPYEKFYPNVGRKSQFAAGTKEHAAKFTHMSMMFMAGLLFKKQGNLAMKVWNGHVPYVVKDSRLKVPNVWLPEYLISSVNPEKNRWNEGQYEPLTASPSWARKIFSDWLFGVYINNNGELVVDPVIPSNWGNKKPVMIKRKLLNAEYEIYIINKNKKESGVEYLIVDNKRVDSNTFKPFKSGKHKIEVYM